MEARKYGEILCNATEPMKKRFRALFALKHIGDDVAIECIEKVFMDPSALLKHEAAYCLGQMQNKNATTCLKRILADVNQEPIVRHEAAEGLGAIGSTDSVETLEKYLSDQSKEVAQTCQIAINRINWLKDNHKCVSDAVKNAYSTIDPAPAFATTHDVSVLKETFLNPKCSLWDRYKAMFVLRNINTDAAISALAEGLRCEDSALFRHETAFVLGQMASPLAVRHLIERLEMKNENSMVRHECAEALGAIGTETCRKVLQEFVNDSQRVVRESCEVALDISDYSQSNEFQYAACTDNNGSELNAGEPFYSTTGM